MKLASDIQQIDWMVGGICTRSKVRRYGYVIKSNNEEATSNISFVFLYIKLRLHVHTLFSPFFPLLTHQEKEEERERQRVHFEKMKEFMRPREDLECDDHKVSLMCAVELAFCMCLTRSERRPQNIYSQEEINLYFIIKLATEISIFTNQ